MVVLMKSEILRMCLPWRRVVYHVYAGLLKTSNGNIAIPEFIPLALVGYEIVIANSALRASLATYHEGPQ